MAEQSIDDVLESPQRKLVVADTDIDLRSSNQNDVFILMVQESHGSAGGRAGGSGGRKIDKVIAFSCSKGLCKRYFETLDPEKIDHFEIPYSAVAMDIVLSTGKQVVVQGLIDPGTVNNYRKLTNNL
ncbi:MAG TPA: hypothetical protein VEH06_17185 [Candidatus Bathyarchaeia archaeon]|jgi:hypothetical protein|nr:hypothetical protein [Candidatus Bathyarchaeia archaeon]